jgi:hypothetical protein
VVGVFRAVPGRTCTCTTGCKSQRIIREGGTYLRNPCGAGGINDGRNEVARNFLDHTDGEWLWFVDSDMGFAPDTVDRLVASASPVARPVVGGLCFALKRIEHGPFHSIRNGVIPTVYDYVELENEVGFVPPGLWPGQGGEASGYGRCVPADPPVGAGEGAGQAVWGRLVRHGDPPDGAEGWPRTFSEDLSFCVRLGGVGVPLHVDTRVKTVHHKGGIFLDEELFLAQQAAAAADQASELAAAG